MSTSILISAKMVDVFLPYAAQTCNGLQDLVDENIKSLPCCSGLAPLKHSGVSLLRNWARFFEPSKRH